GHVTGRLKRARIIQTPATISRWLNSSHARNSVGTSPPNFGLAPMKAPAGAKSTDGSRSWAFLIGWGRLARRILSAEELDYGFPTLPRRSRLPRQAGRPAHEGYPLPRRSYPAFAQLNGHHVRHENRHRHPRRPADLAAPQCDGFSDE